MIIKPKQKKIKIMKKFIALLALVLVSTSTVMYAQETRKQQREAERAKIKAQDQAASMASYQEAIQALQGKEFVLEANQVVFRNGQSVFVTSNTNFVLVNGQKGTVQIAFNTPYPGPNGIGGITVDGTISDMQMNMDKKGNVNCNFTIQGIGISAQIFINMTAGGNNATVTINPNFNSNTMTLNGTIVPLNQSDIFKGRSW